MTARYCFVCDTSVETEVCPTCSTRTWLPTDAPVPARPDEHLKAISAEPQTGPITDLETPAPPLPPPTPPDGEDPPDGIPEERRRPTWKTPGRWAPISGVVVVGLILMAVLAGPSGRAPEDDPVETPEVTAQTTTTVPAPGSSRDLWSPPAGTWVGGFAFTSTRPNILYGTSLAAGLLNIGEEVVIVDSLPDGRLLAINTSEEQVVLMGTGESGPFQEVTPLPWPGPDSTLPLISPDGTRVAVIDNAGVPHVWIVGTDTLHSPHDSASTAVGAIASFIWSADSEYLALNAFQGGYYVWDLVTAEVSDNALPGRAVAISDSQVSAWGGNGLELRDQAGRVLRRWDDLFDPHPTGLSGSSQPEGAFDPQQRFLAVRGRAGPEEGATESLTVVSLIGTTREDLTTDPAQSFAWAGDGSGLYWLNSDGLQAWSADPERASATLVGSGGLDLVPRLRVYDPAMFPVGPPALATTLLFERQAGTLNLRTPGGLETFQSEAELATITPARIRGHFLTVSKGEDEQPVVLANPRDGSQQDLGYLNSLQLPDGARISRAIALTPFDTDGRFTPEELGATRWYIETTSGSILHGPEAGLFTTAAEGSSLAFLAGTAFYVTSDGSAILTIPVGVGINTVLTAEDLEAERILAVGAIRRALFVLVATAGGQINLWQVPADSTLLTTPLYPPTPSMTAEKWLVYTHPEPATGGWILTDPDTGPSGELLAVRIDRPNGPFTVAIAAPLALESVCGASAGGACVLNGLSGSPLGFSPDGNWLLVGDADRYVAVSTVGRGTVSLPDGSPDDVAWVETNQ